MAIRPEFESQIDDLASRQRAITQDSQELAEMQDELRERRLDLSIAQSEAYGIRGSIQDKAFQEINHPHQVAKGGQALEYAEHLLAMSGRDSSTVANEIEVLKKVIYPPAALTPVLFTKSSYVRAAIGIFENGNPKTCSVDITNKRTGYMTLRLDTANLAAVFTRTGSKWEAGPGLYDSTYDLDVEELTITDDPELIQGKDKNDQNIQNIIAVGHQAVSQALSTPENSHQASYSDELMKRLLSKLTDYPIPGKTVDLTQWQSDYYESLSTAIGKDSLHGSSLDNQLPLPLVLHGDLYEEIFGSSENVDVERICAAVAEGLAISRSAGYGAIAGTSSEKLLKIFDDVYEEEGDVLKSATDVSYQILAELMENEILRGLTLPMDKSIWKGVLKYERGNRSSVDTYVAKVAYEQYVNSHKLAGLRRKTWKLIDFMNK